MRNCFFFRLRGNAMFGFPRKNFAFLRIKQLGVTKVELYFVCTRYWASFRCCAPMCSWYQYRQLWCRWSLITHNAFACAQLAAAIMALTPNHRSIENLFLSLWKSHYCVCMCVFGVFTAFAAMIANGTAMLNLDFESPIMFQQITTVGASANAGVTEFICPSSAYYFVFYRVELMSGQCRIDLRVGNERYQVMFDSWRHGE